jgi:hemerythrin-like domain-containing protein
MDLDSALTGKQADSGSATDILRADHEEIRRLIERYEEAAPDSAHARKVLVEAICLQLELHAREEREVFYPAARDTEAEAVNRAVDDHRALDRMAANLQNLAADDPAYDAGARALIAQARRHFEQEESDLFPAVEQRMGDRLHDLATAIMDLKKRVTGTTEDVEGRT